MSSCAGCGTAGSLLLATPGLAGLPGGTSLAARGLCPRSPRTCSTRAGATACRLRTAWRPCMLPLSRRSLWIRQWNPGTYWTPGLGRLRVAAGHRPGTGSAQDCQRVRIYASEQYPRQDSNLRSRLRRAWHHPALTSVNVPVRDPFVRCLMPGAGGLARFRRGGHLNLPPGGARSALVPGWLPRQSPAVSPRPPPTRLSPCAWRRLPACSRPAPAGFPCPGRCQAG
jgi:hypothetical protein